jgi:hypothetical protein
VRSEGVFSFLLLWEEHMTFADIDCANARSAGGWLHVSLEESSDLVGFERTVMVESLREKNGKGIFKVLFFVSADAFFVVVPEVWLSRCCGESVGCVSLLCCCGVSVCVVRSRVERKDGADLVFF